MVTVRELLSRFGKLPEVRAAFEASGVVPAPSVQTISSWQTVGRIPIWWHRKLLDAAARAGVPLTLDELAAASDKPSANQAASQPDAAA